VQVTYSASHKNRNSFEGTARKKTKFLTGLSNPLPDNSYLCYEAHGTNHR